jgi:hypothetical protein
MVYVSPIVCFFLYFGLTIIKLRIKFCSLCNRTEAEDEYHHTGWTYKKGVEYDEFNFGQTLKG